MNMSAWFKRHAFYAQVRLLLVLFLSVKRLDSVASCDIVQKPIMLFFELFNTLCFDVLVCIHSDNSEFFFFSFQQQQQPQLN